MKELNKKTLIKAISDLPQYEAPGFIWEQIEQVLVSEEQDTAIATVIPQLPSYLPPESVWAGIDAALNETPNLRQNNLRIIPWKRIAIAASLIGIALWFSWQQFFPNQEKFALVYSEEQVSQFEYALDLEEDEASFTAMLSNFETSIVAKQHEDYNILLDEYQELKIAKGELVQLMENYGTDPDIIQQISEIEHERSRVIKKMAALI